MIDLYRIDSLCNLHVYLELESLARLLFPICICIVWMEDISQSHIDSFWLKWMQITHNNRSRSKLKVSRNVTSLFYKDTVKIFLSRGKFLTQITNDKTGLLGFNSRACDAWTKWKGSRAIFLAFPKEMKNMKWSSKGSLCPGIVRRMLHHLRLAIQRAI